MTVQCQIAKGAGLGPKGLQGAVAFLGLGRGVGVEERHLLLGDGFTQQDADALALGEPALPQLDDLALGLGLVQTDPARRPAVGERQGAERIQKPRPGHRRQAPHRDDLEPAVAEPGRDAAERSASASQASRYHRRIRRGDWEGSRRDAVMQPGEQVRIVERGNLRQGVRQQVERSRRFPDEDGQGLAPVRAAAGQTVEQPALHAPRVVGRGQPGQGQAKICLECGIARLEPAPALLVEEPGDIQVEGTLGIGSGFAPARLHMQAPAGSEPLERIVEACPHRHQLVFGRGFQVRPPEPERRREGAVLVQDHAGRHESGPWQMIGEGGRASAMFFEKAHRALTRPGGQAGRGAGRSTSKNRRSARAAHRPIAWATAHHRRPSHQMRRARPSTTAIVPMAMA